MTQAKSEFDSLSGSYEKLLKNPLRDVFTGRESDFFHSRKRDLIRDYFRRRQIDSRTLTYLDVGCGQGQLLSLLRNEFAAVSGCDYSPGMLQAARLNAAGIQMHVQTRNDVLPFDNAQFDFVTAVCVYHHVPPPLRDALTDEVRRILKPGGVFAIIEHNPYNPITRLIVRSTPVDDGAILLDRGEARDLLGRHRFAIDDQQYFLYFPERIYRKAARLEFAMRSCFLGGQYAVFGKSQTGPSES